MRVLELFSGTHSVGKVCKELEWEVISLDLKGADINCNILNWDYASAFPPNHFDIIWASPPCHTFSNLRSSHIGRKLKNHNGAICTKELILNDINNIGLPILNKALDIIKYFNPTYYFIENPKTGKMKNYIIDKPFYDVDYCKYSDWGYKKSTRLWTNLQNFKPLKCHNDCNNMSETKKKHIARIGFLGIMTLQDKYRIPPNLIKSLFSLL